MNRLSIPLAIGVAGLLFFVVAACFQAGEGEAKFTEPCVPLPGSDVDPCERRDDWDIGVSASYSLWSLPDRPFDTYRHLKKESARCPSGFCTPHFYVRATVIPGSARCARTEAFLRQGDDGTILNVVRFNPRHERVRWDCFVDIAIHEYFNGTGPRQMPIKLRHGYLDATKSSPEAIDSYARGASLDYEGYEFIFPLMRDVNPALGVWSRLPEEIWDVQRNEDGEVTVVSFWTTVAPEWRSDYEMSLADFRDMTRDGMARYFRETGGRLGTGGINPLRATDASRDGLLGVLTELGAFTVADVTPASAPPAPGANDPYTPGQNILDQTVTASPEVPGGLEDTPTPVSALGDEPIATAEPTATPDPAPIREQEDAPTSFAVGATSAISVL